MFQINKRLEQENTNKEIQNLTKNNQMKIINLSYFKISIVIILIGFLFVFYEYSQNGRYYINNNALIIDTRTGKSFWPVEINNKYEYREKNIFHSKK